MVVLKVIRNSAGGTEYLKRLSYYIKFNRLTGKIRPDFVSAFGFGVDYFEVQSVYEQMLCVQKYFGKVGFNPLLHFVVSFGNDVKKAEDAMRLGLQIAAFYQSKFQVFGGIHKKHRGESYYHLHLMVNAVSFIDGELINSWRTFLHEFMLHISKVTGEYVRLEFGILKEDI